MKGSVIDTPRHLSTIYVSAFLEALDLMVLANANQKQHPLLHLEVHVSLVGRLGDRKRVSMEIPFHVTVSPIETYYRRK